jgi:hypothetical protein
VLSNQAVSTEETGGWRRKVKIKDSITFLENSNTPVMSEHTCMLGVQGAKMF